MLSIGGSKVIINDRIDSREILAVGARIIGADEDSVAGTILDTKPLIVKRIDRFSLVLIRGGWRAIEELE
ncbi:MAG: hypothetical protein WCG51_02295, partial [Elusimicrobiota bacterium]